MSTTPRTDAATFEIISSMQSGTDKVTHADFARQLERDIAELNERLIDRQETLMKQALRLTAMQRVINELYLDTEGYADGAPDASAHDKLCNQISSALHPFFKP